MVRTLIGWRSARFTVVAGGERKRLTGYFVDVANNSVYGGGMYIAPEAEIDDGEFDVVAITEVGKLRFLRGLREVLKGDHIGKEEVTTFRASRLELDASRPFPVYADGDHLTDLPVSLRVLPRCLSILVPAGETPEPTGVEPAFQARLRRQAGASASVRRRQPPQRARRRHDPAGACAAAPGAGGDRPARSQPRPRRDGRQRDQRQDDDGGDDRRDPRRRRPPTGPQPRRLEHDLGSGDGAARAARRARACSRSTRPGCRG